MNKNCYRIIFSQARGMFIAVAEIVKSRSKTAGQSEAINAADTPQFTPQTLKKLNPLNFAVVSLLGAVVYTVPLNSIANTQIIADKSAPSLQQATILNSSNGLTQVNIQTPSAGGVSRNTYTQFDVGQEGAILNNSRNNVQTQLGGWVQGNPWLGKGEAKVILNEVNSSNPSQLKGYLEVAGKSAQVVIANPSGLVCDGCGVINADRFSLAAGQAVVNQGYLESFRVRDGQVTIEGKGLNGSLTPYTDIYARALNVNAGLYANELTTVLGQNDIDVKDQTAPKVNAVNGQSSAQSAKPDFALDVAQLGGMYAGKIFLVGTEQGLGVRNAGSINTTAAQLTLNANGDLVNSGNIIANKGQLDVQAKNIANSGNISSAAAKVTVQSQNLSNSGLISSGDELHLSQSAALQNTGLINAARVAIDADSLSNSGKIQQTGAQALALQAKQISNTAGKIGVAASASSGGSTGGTGSSGGTTDPVAEQPVNQAQDGGSLSVVENADLPVKTYEAGYIRTAQSLNNDSGSIEANGGIDLSTQNGLDNTGGQLQLGQLNVSGGAFVNQSGQLAVEQANIHTDSINNEKGSLFAQHSLILQSQTFNNRKGQVQALDMVSIQTSDLLDNQEGLIAAVQALDLQAGQLNNTEGTLYSEQSSLQLQAQGQINNTAGIIQAAKNSSIEAQSLSNQQGQLIADGLNIQLKTLDNAKGQIQSAGNLKIQADSIQNQQGQLIAQHALSLASSAAALSNQSGQISAGADIQIDSYGLNNDAGLIQAEQNLKINAQNQNLSNQQSGASGGLIAQNALSIQNVKQLNSQQGFIGANGAVEISAQQLQNQKGQISSAADVTADVAGEVNNQEGQITAQGNISLRAAAVDNSAVSSAGSQIIAGKDLQINAEQLLNSQTAAADGQGIHAQNIQMDVQSLDNRQGAIRANNNAQLKVEQQLENAKGLISAANLLQLQSDSQQLNIQNQQGQLLTGGQLQIDAKQLSGDGQVISLGDADIALTDSYQHGKDAVLQANGQLNLALQQDLDNSGAITAGNVLNVQANNIRNLTADASLQAQQTALNAVNSIYNAGLINGDATVLKAVQIDNEGTGRIYGTALALQADTLNNRPDAAGKAPVIAARERLDIGVTTLNNLANTADYDSQALILSAGDFYLGGALDQNHQAAGTAQTINNAGARIEALGDLYFSAQQVNNSNANFDSDLVLVDAETGLVKEYRGGWKTFDGQYFGGNGSEDWTVYKYDIEHYETQVTKSAPGLIQAGGNLNFENADSIVNDKSQILAGQQLNVNGISADQSKVLENTAEYGLTKVLYSGTQELHYLDGGGHKHKINYNPWMQESLGSEELGVSIAKPFMNLTGSNASIDSVQADALDLKIDQADSTAGSTKDQVDLAAAAGIDTEIRAVDNSQFKVPNSALYKVNKDSSANYLIETDPAFANYKNWLSSDYMLSALGLDPSMQQKRLGDGYYEQRMVQDQIAQLTGFRFLEGYGSDEEQYKALMNNGLSFAQAYGLRPGIALTAAQIAQLTSDIVWLEEKEVTLPNGSKQKALVPQVYVKARTGDLKGDGSLISAESININLQGDVLNSAVIAGRNAVVLNAENVDLLNGRIQANQAAVSTAKDLNIVGGQIHADQSIQLNVGGDFNLNTTTLSSEHQIGQSYFSQTGIDRVAGLYVNGALNTQNTDTENLSTTISVRVGGNTQMKAAEIANSNGATVIQTAGDVDVGTVSTGRTTHIQSDAQNFNHSSYRTDAGSQIAGQGDIYLTGQNIQITGSDISSVAGTAALSAQDNLTISEGRAEQKVEARNIETGGSAFSKKTSDSYFKTQRNEALASSIDGNKVILDGNNVSIRGSNVISDDLTQIQAKENISIKAAENQSSEVSESTVKKSGFTASVSDGVASVGYGKSNVHSKDAAQSTDLTQSTVSSLSGDVNIVAGKDLTAEAAQLSAAKDLNLQGANVNLNALTISQEQQSQFDSKQSGLSVGITYSAEAAAASSVKKSKENSDFSDSVVGKIMSSAETARKASMAAATPVVITASHQKINNSSQSISTQSVGTEVTAGGNLNIIATDGDIRSQGAKISAEGDALLHAKNNIDLLAVSNTESQSADTKRSGFSIDTRDHLAPLGVYNDKGIGDGSLSQSVGTELSVGGKTVLQTEAGDINIIGSKVVSQDDLSLSAGRDINIQSAQSTQNQSESQKSKGWGSAQISDTERFDGYMANQNKTSSDSVTQERSQLGSLDGNVNITAGNNYNQKVADVVAGKDINISAKNISIVDDQNTGSDSQSSKDLKVGVFSRITSPLIDLINAVDNAGKSKADDRTQALQGLAAGAQAYQTANTINNVQKDIAALAQNPDALTSKAALFKAEAGIGFSTSKNNQDNSYSASQGNVLNAGGNINLTSTEGDIHLKNTQVNAKDKISLDAAKDILLESGQSKEYADGKNSNAGAQIGVGVSVGAQTGAYVYAEAGYGKGSNHLESTTHNNTTLNADQISLKSKGDTTLKGAQATANRIDADVGGNLNIISEQDTLDQNSKQMGVGARVQVSAGTAWDASGNFNNSSAKGNSKSVNEQSGLFAGEGGYHVKADHVDLQGGAIASTASKEHNDLTTNSLKFSNIENESSHNATTVALSGGTRFGEEKGKDSTGTEYTNNVNWRDSTTFSPTLPQQDKDSDSSTTYATISEGNINIGGKDTTVQELGIHSDINTANQQVADIPDLQAILDKQKIVSDATSTIVAATRTYSQNKQAEAEVQKQAAEVEAIEKLKAEGGADWEKYNSTDDYVTKQNLLKNALPAYKDASDQAQAWGMGGDSSRALNAVTTAITAALGGQTDLQVVTNTLAPYAAQVIGQEFGHGEDKNTAAQLVSHAILGATLAYINGGDPTAGGSAAVASEAAANYLTNQLAERYKDDPKYFVNGEFQANLLSEAEKAQIRDLTAGIGAVIGGAVGDSTYNAQLAGVIGQNAVENNELFKVNDKGDFIACFEVFGLSCSPRQGERAATEQDIRNGAINIAIDVAAGSIAGRFVKIVKNGYEVGGKVFNNVDDAIKAIEKIQGKSSSIYSPEASKALKTKLKALSDAQKTAAKTQELPDGRIRYYEKERLAAKDGPTRGSSFVTEYDPKTGNVRQWNESYDKSGNVNRVHPKSINGQTVTGQHYPPTGKEKQMGAK